MPLDTVDERKKKRGRKEGRGKRKTGVEKKGGSQGSRFVEINSRSVPGSFQQGRGRGGSRNNTRRSNGRKIFVFLLISRQKGIDTGGHAVLIEKVSFIYPAPKPEITGGTRV